MTLWALRLVRTIRITLSAHFTFNSFCVPFQNVGVSFPPFVRLLSFLFFLFHWGLGCSHFHTEDDEDDEVIHLRFFFSFSFLEKLKRVSFTKIAHRINQSHCADDGTRENTTTFTTFHCAQQKGRRDGLAFFFDSSKSKNKNTLFCLLRSQSVFSRSSSSSSSSFEEEVEKKSNGVVWLERIRLIGQRPQRHHREGDAIIKKGFGALGTKR